MQAPSGPRAPAHTPTGLGSRSAPTAPPPHQSRDNARRYAERPQQRKGRAGGKESCHHGDEVVYAGAEARLAPDRLVYRASLHQRDEIFPRRPPRSPLLQRVRRLRFHVPAQRRSFFFFVKGICSAAAWRGCGLENGEKGGGGKGARGFTWGQAIAVRWTRQPTAAAPTWTPEGVRDGSRWEHSKWREKPSCAPALFLFHA